MSDKPVAEDLTVLITTIPTRKDRLKIAYESVLNQTLLPKEIIIEEDINKLGAPKNRDNGIAKVKTKYVALLDDDDYFYPFHLELLYDTIIETESDIVYSWFDVIGGTDPFPWNFGKPWDPENPTQTTITTMCKTDIIRTSGGYTTTVGLNEEQLKTYAQGNVLGEDMRFIINANNMGAKITHIPKRSWAYCHWSKSDGSVGNTSGMPTRW